MRMRPGECRTTRRGAKYCYTARGVRFVGKGRRTSRSYRGTSGLSGRRSSRPMRMGECRVTRRGQEYCRLPEGVRFVGGGRRY